MLCTFVAENNVKVLHDVVENPFKGFRIVENILKLCYDFL